MLRSDFRMKTVSVRQLKNNPSAAHREARERPVMALNRHQPEALLVHPDNDSLLAEPGIREERSVDIDSKLDFGIVTMLVEKDDQYAISARSAGDQD